MSFGFGKTDENSKASKPSSPPFKMTKEAPGMPMGKSVKSAVPVVKNAPTDSNNEVYIGSGAKLEGDFFFAGPTYINCKITGDIKGDDAIHLGPEAIIMGNVMGVDVVIAGCVKGNVEGTASICLEKPADLVGDIVAPKITVSDGVMFNGRCSMT